MKNRFALISGEQFELLVGDVLRDIGFTIEEKPSSGSDKGKDIIASRFTTDDMGIQERERYLVECKNFSNSNRSVLRKDVGDIISKLSLHQCNKYLIACTTILSATLNDYIKAISDNNALPYKCTAWNKNDIERYLEKFPSIRRKYWGTPDVSFQEKIVELAQYVREHHFEAHRGAVLFCSHYGALFGNDGYHLDISGKDLNPAVQQELTDARKKLFTLHCKEVGFGLSKDGGTWVLIVDNTDCKSLFELIWSCWKGDKRILEIQNLEAFKRIWTYWNKPFFKTCSGVH